MYIPIGRIKGKKKINRTGEVSDSSSDEDISVPSTRKAKFAVPFMKNPEVDSRKILQALERVIGDIVEMKSSMNSLISMSAVHSTELERTHKLIKKYYTSADVVASEENIKFKVPVENTDELSAIEAVLEDVEQRGVLLRKCSKIGGNKVSSVVNSILDAVLSKKMQATVSVCGKKGKVCLMNKTLYRIIVESARSSPICSHLTDKDIQQAIQVRLSSSGQFVKEKREASTVQSHSQTENQIPEMNMMQIN